MYIIRPFTWYGGKLRMLLELLCLIPLHTIWCEPFMGSAVVTLNHARSEKEIINDFDSDLVNFFKVLQDQTKGRQMIDKLLKMEYSRETFETAKQYKKDKYTGFSDVERAVWEYVLISQSFNKTRKSFSESKDTFKFHMDILQNLFEIQKRLKNIEIHQGDGTALIDSLKDKKDAFLFLDPPYVADTRAKGARNVYGKEMSDPEQVRLLKTIQHAKSKILLCGYESRLYDEYLLPYGYKRYKLCDIVKACQFVEGKEKDFAEEFIWVNYELPFSAKYAISLKEYDCRQENFLDTEAKERSNSPH